MLNVFLSQSEYTNFTSFIHFKVNLIFINNNLFNLFDIFLKFKFDHYFTIWLKITVKMLIIFENEYILPSLF